MREKTTAVFAAGRKKAKWSRLWGLPLIARLRELSSKRFDASLNCCQELGRGELNWPRVERVTDRFGVVGLYRGDDRLPLEGQTLAGTVGSLLAHVIELRQFPKEAVQYFTIPAVGEVIVLGRGRLFFERDEYGDVVGLSPDDSRTRNWLDPEALRLGHWHSVRLHFHYPLIWDEDR